MSDEYEADYERACPVCDHSPIHSRDCTELLCENGWIDESDEWYEPPGSIVEACDACLGTGIEVWCPNCGENLSGHDFGETELPEPEDPNQLKLF